MKIIEEPQLACDTSDTHSDEEKRLKNINFLNVNKKYPVKIETK